ncbi:MAG: hypothetical protein RJA25_1777 [Bacteroidota bacterium]|jgi:hypothetical protein
MQNQKDRIIIDTNLWISFLITKDFTKLDSIIKNKKVTLVFSQELLDEFMAVSQRKKIKKYFELDDLRNLILAIKQQAIFVNVTSKETICRDAKDNFLLSLAKDSKATHLITGDKDLLILENYNATKIINITTYFQLNKI